MILHRISYYLFLLLFVFISLFTTGCGLNSYPYIEAPDVRELTGSSGVFMIYNRSDNDPDVFQGYELYYKFYDNSSATSQMASDERQLFTVEYPEPPALVALGFKRMETTKRTDEKTNYPMISVPFADRDNAFTIELDFSNVEPKSEEKLLISEATKYSAKYLSRNITLYRAVLDPDPDSKTDGIAKYKSFGDLLNSQISGNPMDSDIPSGAASITLSLYVFAYGKQDRVYNIYSKPVWLGHINYIGF